MKIRINDKGGWEKEHEGKWYEQRCLEDRDRVCGSGCPFCRMEEVVIGNETAHKEVTILHLACRQRERLIYPLTKGDIVIVHGVPPGEPS